MQKKSIIACLPAATAPRVPTPMPLSAAAKELRSVPAGGIRRRDRTVAAAASRTGPVEAASAYASQGNDARQAAAASDPTAVASGKAKLEGRPPAPQDSRPTTYRAGKGKVWLSPLGLNFPASPCRSPPFPTRQSPGLRPSAQLTDYSLGLFPQRQSLGGGHLELPDSSAAVATASRTVEASGSGGRGSRGVAHVLTA